MLMLREFTFFNVFFISSSLGFNVKAFLSHFSAISKLESIRFALP